MIYINGRPVHRKITPERVAQAVERSVTTTDNPGFCINCGAEVEGVEPDAKRYKCQACEQPGVYGAELLLALIA